jgi:serine/threonine-protein kinase
MPDKEPIRVLVVDDDETNRDLLSRRLLRQGYSVQMANDGSQALEVLQRQSIDLVLLDVMMPKIDGLQVLTTIRETHSMLDLPVIMVTARDQGGDVAAALQMGANDHVPKPINFTVLFARMQTQLAMRAGARLRTTQTEPTAPLSNEATTPGRSYAGGALEGTQVDLPTLGDQMTIGDYQVIEEIGRGGMGVVYKAKHLRMNRIVALKLIDKDRLGKPDAVARFYKEVELAAKLHHPNVVIAYDAGQVRDTHFFAMEYVDGVDLDAYVHSSGKLGANVACDFIRQAALGLQHAHEAGLVHRDIKPSNLLVTWMTKSADGTPANRASATATMRAVIKILDMGLARLHQPSEDRGSAGELTREGRVVGSVDFMAPEQWMDATTVDIRADLYSLGCTMYYLLSGQVPFPGAEPMEKMLKHHLDQPTPIEQLRPDVSPKVLAVVKRLMSKRREERYQTPGELAMLLNWICQADFGA